MVIYFSAEGNTQYVAETIAEATGEKIFSIRDALEARQYEISIPDGENLGLCVPTYFQGFPTIVAEYLNNAQIQLAGSNHYVYFVATYGASYGNIGRIAEKVFAEKGIRLDASYSIAMTDTWVPYFDMTDAEYVKKTEERGEHQLQDVKEKIIQHAHELLQNTISDADEQKAADWYERARDTKLFSVSDKCVGCGLCARQCPLHRIQLKDGHPVWDGEKCTLCLGCLHRCPVNAIRYTHDTVGHGQYINQKAGRIH